ncbi:hypothetical protein [Methylobacterium sp.]|uniref:hypothetical protein n=1 Tax=Methylobacterium sp. TaxID=409 RepID=UPI0025D63870|nr:hypothetical protein [Methylobacterium sp.]MBY0258997.1 hypothetical protein [Methylobacterium sp.]
MITVQETKSRELATPADIVAYLSERYAAATAGDLAPGDAVDISARAGMPPEFAAGDVAIFLCDVPSQPFAYILALNSGGREMAVQVQRSNLTKRATA